MANSAERETQLEKNLPSEYTDGDFDFNFGCNKRSLALPSTQLTFSAPAQRYFVGSPLAPFTDNKKKNSQNTIIRRFQLERIERCRYQPTLPLCFRRFLRFSSSIFYWRNRSCVFVALLLPWPVFTISPNGIRNEIKMCTCNISRGRPVPV